MAGMTENDLEILRLKFKLEIHHQLLRAICIALARSIPNGRQHYLGVFAELRKEHSKIAIKGLDAAYSDMISAEYQEALDDTLSDIENGIQAVP